MCRVRPSTYKGRANLDSSSPTTPDQTNTGACRSMVSSSPHRRARGANHCLISLSITYVLVVGYTHHLWKTLPLHVATGPSAVERPVENLWTVGSGGGNPLWKGSTVVFPHRFIPKNRGESTGRWPVIHRFIPRGLWKTHVPYLARSSSRRPSISPRRRGTWRMSSCIF